MWGVRNASEQGTKSAVPEKWANWLHTRMWDPKRCGAGARNHKWPTSGRIGYVTLAVHRVPNTLEWAPKSEVAPNWADGLHNPWRMWDRQRLRAGAKINSLPQRGGLATSPLPSGGVPNSSERWTKSEVVTSGRITYVSLAFWKVCNTSHRRGKNKNCPTSGLIGYITPAV